MNSDGGYGREVKIEEVLKRIQENKNKLLGDGPIDQARKTISMDDISQKEAERSFNGTSHSPERRGLRVRQDYVTDLNKILDDLSKGAKTEEQKILIRDEFAKFKETYTQKQKELLSSHSNITSSFIAGGSNFPVRRMEKINRAYDNKYQAYREWESRAISAIQKRLGNLKVEEAGGELAITKKQLEKIKTKYDGQIYSVKEE